jgi:hypothetical protein
MDAGEFCEFRELFPVPMAEYRKDFHQFKEAAFL